MTNTANKKPTFSSLFKELDEIVAECESGEIDLEQSLPKFRRGLEVARDLQKRLSVFENEIITIKKEFSDVVEKSESDELLDESEENIE